MDDAPPTRLHLAIEGSGVPFAAALDAFRAFLDAAGVGPTAHYTATLAFEELVVNVLRHAGIRPGPGQAVVDVEADVADDAVRFSVEDRGRRLGVGLGIRLVMRSVDRIEYARTAWGNRVEVTVLRAREDG